MSGGIVQPKTKNWKKRIIWTSIITIISVWFIVTFQYIGDIEANTPFITLDPSVYYQIKYNFVTPYYDKLDNSIIYLAFVNGAGDSVKIDLKSKTVTPYHFDVKKWEDIDNLAIPYILGDHPPSSPISIELRGREFTHSVLHLFGFPYPNSVGTYQAHFRFGYWYVMDNRNGTKVSLLRIRVWNSELNWDGFGDAYVSPDGKWTVFQVGGIHPTVYIFDRTATGSEDFK